ncbi:sensor histidine kinase [Roseiterribacter gracilis]|uniref:Histidine kinase n=1 Tax=Roseiterribacter gracilis TaxID=2812848 RepID=A0A8S8X8D7_9PROT|nr:histidine kinase [Rhodospirillales bacterium TMPK1]
MQTRLSEILVPVARLLRVLPLLVLGAAPAQGLDPTRDITQFRRTTYRIEDGAPARITDIAQAQDGVLWFGTHNGLFHFDGVRFTRYLGGPGNEIASDDIASLYAPPEGGLWIGFYYGGIAFLKDGRLRSYGAAEGLPGGSVNAITRDLDGTMWIGTNTGTARLVGAHWELTQGPAWNKTSRENVLSLLVDRDGTLWEFTGSRRLGFLPRGSHKFEIYLRGDPDAYVDYRMPLAMAPDGRLWLADPQHGIRPVDRAAEATGNGTPSLSVPVRRQMLFDRDGNLWSAGTDLTRVLAPLPKPPARHVLFEQLELDQGLTFALFEDREGNIWTGSSAGLTRLSPRPLFRALENYRYFALVTDKDGSLWAAAMGAAQRQPLFHVVGGDIVQRAETSGSIVATYRDADGTIWFAYKRVLAQMTDRGLVETDLPDDVTGAGTMAMARARDGAMWVSMLRNGVFRLDGKTGVQNGGIATLPLDTTAYVMANDAQGRLLLGYTDDRFAVVDGTTAKLFTAADGLHVGNVGAFAVRGDRVWIGGEHGLALFDGSKIVALQSETPGLFRQITGIVERAGGDLWIGGGAGIVRIARSEIDMALRDPRYRLKATLFDHRDGLPGTIQQRRPMPSVAETADGKIWFAASNGLAWIEPARIERNELPPPVLIWSVTDANGTALTPAPSLDLPAGTSQIRIAYTANSFTVPERVRFRTKLEGVDTAWQDAGDRREATYTNLGPGTYRFRVIAANNDGVWNETGASLALTIAPFPYQTDWFRGLCAALLLVVLVLLYRLRIWRLRVAVHARLEERIVERERIARDLHDTLLQGLQGLILRFQAATAKIPPHEPARAMMDSALSRADDVLIESRDKVKDLRASTQGLTDLPAEFAEVGATLAQDHAAEFRITVEGTPCELHPIVQDEISLIGREALSNAFRHARARTIEVDLIFDRSELRLRVRDDGCGISEAMLKTGKPGHWGLAGMRERARQIRGQFQIWSNDGAGTEIELRVPASMVYRDAPRRFGWRFRSATA